MRSDGSQVVRFRLELHARVRDSDLAFFREHDGDALEQLMIADESRLTLKVVDGVEPDVDWSNQ